MVTSRPLFKVDVRPLVVDIEVDETRWQRESDGKNSVRVMTASSKTVHSLACSIRSIL